MTKRKFEIDFEDIHVELLEKLIPFYGNDLNEVMKYISVRFIDDFIFQNKFSIMKKELECVKKNKKL